MTGMLFTTKECFAMTSADFTKQARKGRARRQLAVQHRPVGSVGNLRLDFLVCRFFCPFSLSAISRSLLFFVLKYVQRSVLGRINWSWISIASTALTRLLDGRVHILDVVYQIRRRETDRQTWNGNWTTKESSSFQVCIPIWAIRGKARHHLC